MSGYKRATVKISEEEYRRLHEADMKRRLRGHSRPRGKKTGQTAELTGALQEIESRQQQLEQAFDQLEPALDEMESQMLQELRRENALHHQGLMTLIAASTSDAQDSVTLLSEQLTEQMNREREQYQQGIQALVSRLDAYQQHARVKGRVARQWLSRAVVLADFIQDQFNHERWLPGRLGRVRASLHMAQDNLAQGFAEASLQMSQQAFLELNDMHFELERCLVEWHTEYVTAHNALSRFVDELEMNSKVKAFGLEGEELPEQVDLAFWSGGRYQQLLSKCRQLLAVLAQDQRAISTEELRRTHTELIPVLMEKFDSMVYDARLEALSSQLRMNIAERALEALEVHGFRLNQSGYANEDMRAPFNVVLENVDGSTVTIQVLPTAEKQELTNELIVISNHPHLRTEHEARLQWQELCQSLHQDNLHVSRPAVRPRARVLEAQVPPERLQDQQPTYSERQGNVR